MPPQHTNFGNMKDPLPSKNHNVTLAIKPDTASKGLRTLAPWNVTRLEMSPPPCRSVRTFTVKSLEPFVCVPSFTCDSRPRLCCMPRCPYVVHLSFQQGLDWFEPHSFLQLLHFMTLCLFLLENVLCMSQWRLCDVFWTRILQN